MPLSREEALRVREQRPKDENQEQEVFMELFSDLMNAIAGRNLMSALECAELLAALESREKQKAFCNFAGECVRKIFMTSRNMSHIAGIEPHEQEFYENMAGKFGVNFCTRTITNIEKVVAMIDRNVNSKILFCDLVNRMFISI